MIVEFHPQAGKELITSSEFYETKATGLSDEFLNEVKRIVKILEDNPLLGVDLKSPFRRAVLHRFPFSLIYIVEENKLWIVSVAHQRLKPGYWQDRIKR